ncbi:MAG: rhodanese-like domain-containing protein [Chloroflexi bacterium]|nr:MAG: rhodanese-like domain-containing protein [Chloroflexota bacterium]
MKHLILEVFMMKTITREELKRRLDLRERIQLVMVLKDWAFESLHIPGSVHYDSYYSLAEAAKTLSPDEEIIVYCANPACPASYRAYHFLKSLGFRNVFRYSGGIEDWMNAGYPLEGSLAGEPAWAAA